eukprot:CAMPEP_0206631718 /NCGR_PEP_ID=MMETSP0325_2-20121206/68422_1 /ASSEMBLY_ACC=CAM_ASM_000347 /TAXON_ID=2866 /ORGANISM="Crypthecodinium cohnii, Strain Seligo" /LENGTH=54 /DNA_ID=CAMNT_0054156995 /DNA_START=144 /DNA_END=305 /DNA_ORIENTATION=+
MTYSRAASLFLHLDPNVRGSDSLICTGSLLLDAEEEEFPFAADPSPPRLRREDD